MTRVASLREGMARGAACLTDEGREAIAAFVLSCRRPDGGFAGDAAASDLYYTVFATAVLQALGCPAAQWSPRTYLAAFGDGDDLDFVHRACLARLIAEDDRLDRVLAGLETYRSRDGGYHHALPDAHTGSAYAIHLALEAYADADSAPPGPERLGPALESLRTPDGGYANDPGEAAGQTSATAAACLARLRLGLDAEPGCEAFLLAQHDATSGGFLACPGARVADLLSTASALHALGATGTALDAIAPQCRAFVEALWTDAGGFCGTPLDTAPDCEYTGHALLALGALA